MSGRALSPAPLELLQWPREAAGGHGCAAPLGRVRLLRSDAVFAASTLSGTLALVYAFAGVTILGAAPRSGAILLAIGAAQAGLAIWVRRSPGRRAIAGAGLAEVLLAGLWLVSRTLGLPSSGAAHPVDVLGTLVAADELLLALLVAGMATNKRLRPCLVEVALVLAAMSLTGLATGHTHGTASERAGAGAPGAPQHFYCRLL